MSKWPMVRLGDVCEITAGQGAPQGDDEYCLQGTPFIKAGNLSSLICGTLENQIQQVSSKIAKKYKLKLYPKGTVLFAKSGMSCMKGYVYKLKNDSYVVNHLACIIPHKVHDSYLKYFLIKFPPNRLIKDKSYPSISLYDISNIEIPIPTLNIQKHIADTLDKTQEIIDGHKKQLNELDDLIKAIFYEMFGDPVTNEKNWNILQLSELGELGRGVSKHRPRNAPELLGGIYPFIQTGDIANSDLYISEFTQTYNELGLSQSKMWHEGTLCITIAANIAKTAILGFDACFPDSVVGFCANENSNNIFIHYWFGFFQAILEAQAPESAQKNINLRILNELKVINPPPGLQTEFAEIVTKIEEQKAIVKQAITESENLFNSLMSEYFG